MGLKIGLLLGIALIAGFVKGAEYTPYSVTTCSNGNCSVDITAYERFWLNKSNSNEWEEINESFRNIGNGLYKTRKYHYSAEGDSQGNIKIDANLTEFTSRMLTLFDLNPYFRYAEDNVLVYGVWDNYVYINHTYFPDHLKEDIVFEQALPLKGKQKKPFNITFAINGSASIAFPYMCDASGECTNLEYWATNDSFTLTVLPEWVANNTRPQPVVLDPTIVLNGTNVTWDGYAELAIGDLTWTRQMTSNPVKCGWFRNSGGDVEPHNCTLAFTLTGILPSGYKAHVSEAIYQLQVSQAPSTTGNNHQFRPLEMEQAPAAYPNTGAGNFLFANDIGNGTQLSATITISGTGRTNFSMGGVGRSVLEGKLNDSAEWFGWGFQSMVASLPGVAAVSEWQWRPSEATLAGNRPHLYITYEAIAPSTCAYGGSGDWYLDCGCNVTTNTNVQGNSIYTLGTGSTVNVSANIENYLKWQKSSPGCLVIFKGVKIG